MKRMMIRKFGFAALLCGMMAFATATHAEYNECVQVTSGWQCHTTYCGIDAASGRQWCGTYASFVISGPTQQADPNPHSGTTVNGPFSDGSYLMNDNGTYTVIAGPTVEGPSLADALDWAETTQAFADATATYGDTSFQSSGYNGYEASYEGNYGDELGDSGNVNGGSE